jgi:hypothetical protein
MNLGLDAITVNGSEDEEDKVDGDLNANGKEEKY